MIDFTNPYTVFNTIILGSLVAFMIGFFLAYIRRLGQAQSGEDLKNG